MTNEERRALLEEAQLTAESAWDGTSESYHEDIRFKRPACLGIEYSCEAGCGYEGITLFSVDRQALCYECAMHYINEWKGVLENDS